MYKLIFLSGIASLVATQSPASELTELIEDLTDRFIQQCNAAMSAPADYIAEANAAPPDAEVNVIEGAQGSIYFVQRIAPSGEIAVRFMQAEPDRIRIFCQAAHFNNPVLMNDAATAAELDKILAARDEIRHVGGAIDLKNPVAGHTSETGQMMQHVSPIHHHLFIGWSDTPLIAQAWIQANMYEITTETVLDGALEDGS